LRELRSAGIAADIDLSDRSIKAQFKQADRESAKLCLILGDDELKNGQVTVKNLGTGEQSSIPRVELIERMRSMIPDF
jgi:histidyl-tRNA synthetase